MSRIFWDANLFIYLFEDAGPRTQAAAQLLRAMRSRNDQLFTSALAVAEILVQPTSRGETELCDAYLTALKRDATILGFALPEARHCAAIRNDRAIRAADAIHLACAAAAGMDLFVTNDTRLQGKHIPGIQFIVPLERVPL